MQWQVNTFHSVKYVNLDPIENKIILMVIITQVVYFGGTIT